MPAGNEYYGTVVPRLPLVGVVVATLRSWAANLPVVTMLSAALYVPAVVGAELLRVGGLRGVLPDALDGAVTFALTTVLSGMLAPTVSAHRSGLRVPTIRAVRAGLARVPIAIVVATLYWALMLVGLCALIVPGLLVAAALYVAVPATASERLGPLAGLRRSLRLTSGNKLRILILFWIAGTLYTWVTIGVVELQQTLDRSSFDLAPYLVPLLFNPPVAVLAAVVHDQLVRDRDGVAPALPADLADLRLPVAALQP